jgi:outer membrane protein TolC
MFNRRHPLAALAVLWLWTTAGAPAVAAQTTADVPAAPLTLEQVLALAEKRSETIAISRAGVQRAEGERTRARSGLYPQLSASASYDRALASEFEGIFDTGDVGGGDDEGGFEDLPFGRENTWRISLALSQNLYTGGRQTAQNRIAEAGREAASLGVSTSRAQLLFDVTQAYYDATLSDRLVRIAEATREQADATLRQTQAGFDAGTQPEFELVRARVTRDTQTPLVIRQRANREVALLRLKQLLDLPQDFNLQLADSLGDERLPPPAAFAASVAPFEQSRPFADPAAVSVATPADIAVPDRTVVDEAAAAVRLREASLSLTEAQRKPQVSLNSTYTRLAYPVNFLPAFDRSNWSVGATLNIPVLTGGRQRGDEQVARAELEQARLQLRQTQELAALDSRSAWAELIAARAAWEASAGTVQQAGRAHEIADVRYRAGVSTQLELSDARLLLQQAEVNRAQAARDLQVARARMALLPDLPLGTASPRLPQGQPQQVPVPQPAGNGPVGSNALRQTGGVQTGGFQGGGFQAGVR